MHKASLLFVLGVLLTSSLQAQDVEYARKVVANLCSPEMSGRGYVNRGQQKAAAYIKKEFDQEKLSYFQQGYAQEFGFSAISFPNTVSIVVDDKELETGVDFILSSGCPNVKGVFNLVWVDSATLDDPEAFKQFERVAFYKSFLVIDRLKGKKINNAEAAEKVLKNGYKAKGVIIANQEKLTASVSLNWDSYPVIFASVGVFTKYQTKLSIQVEAEANDYVLENIIGYVQGNKYPDSFIVISAHYDHLGMMGRNVIFPGANDNASGVAMMLDLMKHIKKNPLPFSVVFMAFAAEEIGLLGSLYYTEKPLFPLNQISMLINLDLMGTGDKGMTVVNATLFPEEFQSIQLLNITNDLLPTVNPRGKAANSDHHYFTEKGVKAFFFYLMGEYKYYHDVNDSPEALTFSRYNQAFTLISQFLKEYSTR